MVRVGENASGSEILEAHQRMLIVSGKCSYMAWLHATERTLWRTETLVLPTDGYSWFGSAPLR